MKPEPGPETAAVDAALTAWRHKASDILLIALSATFLPEVVLVILGDCPPVGLLARALVIVAYLLLCAAALFRRVEYRRRAWVSVLALYSALLIGNLVNPRGPYGEIGLIAIPIYVLVLLGAPAARIAIGASAAIVVSAPVLRAHLDVLRLLGIKMQPEVTSFSLDWFPALVQIALLFTVMFLLDRFLLLLRDTLTQRIAAQRKMEDEMNERQRLEREIAAVGDSERRRLGHELHDGVCQQFTAALLHSQVLRRRLRSGDALSEGDFQPLSSLLSEGIGEARNIARGLCPLDPDPESLAPALRALARRIREIGTTSCEFTTEGDVRVPDPVQAQHLYRIAQEALSNAVRHAHASRIALELRRTDHELLLLVEDNGAGLPQKLPAAGMGLRTMAYRAEIMGGELTLAPAPTGGTRITCRIPVPAEAPAGGRAA